MYSTKESIDVATGVLAHLDASTCKSLAVNEEEKPVAPVVWAANPNIHVWKVKTFGV